MGCPGLHLQPQHSGGNWRLFVSLGSAWTTMLRHHFTNPLKWRQALVEDLPIFARRTEEMRLHARGKRLQSMKPLGARDV